MSVGRWVSFSVVMAAMLAQHAGAPPADETRAA